jgi:hypothetical protein
MTYLMVFIFRKYNETQDLEVDYNDKNQPLNDSYDENMAFKVKLNKSHSQIHQFILPPH